MAVSMTPNGYMLLNIDAKMNLQSVVLATRHIIGKDAHAKSIVGPSRRPSQALRDFQIA